MSDAIVASFFIAGEWRFREYSYDGSTWGPPGGAFDSNTTPILFATLPASQGILFDYNAETLSLYLINESTGSWTLVDAQAMPGEYFDFIAPLAANAIITYTGTDLLQYQRPAASWVQVGADFAFSGIAGLVGLTDTRFAAVYTPDFANYFLQMFEISGGTIAPLGSSIILPSYNTYDPIAITVDTILVPVESGSNTDVMAYQFDGANWSSVYTPLSIASNLASVAPLSETEIVVLPVNIPTATANLQAYELVSGNWVVLGSPLALSTATMYIEPLTYPMPTPAPPPPAPPSMGLSDSKFVGLANVSVRTEKSKFLRLIDPQKRRIWIR